MTPETKGTDKRLEWLDEQRRKDAEALGRLSERMASLEGSLGAQAKQLQGVASDLTKLSAQVSRVQRFDEALEKHRKDISQRLATAQKRQIERQRELEGLWKADQKQAANSMDGLRAELAGLEQLRQGMAARQQEAAQLRQAHDGVDGRVEKLLEQSRDRARAMAAVEESQAQDSRRLAELQAGQIELRKSLDAQAVRLDHIDDTGRRFERRTGELEAGQEELRESQRLSQEQQAAQLAEFQRGWKGWEHQFQDFSAQADQLNERMLSYEETYRSLQQVRGEMEEVIQRLERRITEVGELQRLAEDRMKQEWTAFKADNQKRWSGQQLAEEERWKDHERRHERIDAQLEDQQGRIAAAVSDITELAEVSRRRVLDALAMIREWASELASTAEEVR